MQKAGFTIIELTICIVVIGILATIVTASYKGYQERARNLATVTAVKAYITAFELHLIKYDKYPDAIYISPTSSTSISACLGEGYPDTNGDGIGDCYSTTLREERPELTAALSPFMKKPLPRVNNEPVQWSDEEKRGAFIINRPSMTVDGVANPYHIQYYLEGETNCLVPSLKSASSYPTMSANNPDNNSGVSNGNTRCIIALENP